MPFESRIFRLAKDTEHPEDYQDAWGLDAARGIAAVADGVTSSIFARHWAGILTEATVAEPPTPSHSVPAAGGTSVPAADGTEEAFAHWLQLRRQAWSQQIDTSSLAWFQKAKLPLGAFSTLLWVQVSPVEEDQPGTFGAHRLRGFAIGDSCLFHVRHGEVLRTFPIQKAEELEVDPLVLGSVDLGRDELLRFGTLDELCYPDDLLVLCTDAIAGWALRLGESGNPPAWENYWNASQGEWEEEIVRLRDRDQMRYDDATLMLLRVTQRAVEVSRPQQGPATAEAVELEPPAVTVDELPTVPEGDWKEKLRSAGQQVAEGIETASDEALRGLQKWKKKAGRKIRDKFGPDDK